jgi:hypothetical protein
MLFLKAAPPHHIHALRMPSAAKIAAGNYKMLHRKVQGMDITIENPRGSMRAGVDDAGRAWKTGMQHDYGYIKRTLGVDGDHFDCFVGPRPDAPEVYVITTLRPPGFTEADEQKAMIGFGSEAEARTAFHQHYDDPRFLADLTAMPAAEFKRKVHQTRENPTLMKGLLLMVVARKS